MRRESNMSKHCTLMYKSLRIERDSVLHKTKLLLKIYRPVVWTTARKADEVCESAEIYSGRKAHEALEYLANFAPETKQEEFMSEVDSLFETKWLVSLIEHAMDKIYSYPDNGKLYHEILNKQYFTVKKYTEHEILEQINLERSTFYCKKKEAIELFCICLWGYTIPALRAIHLLEKHSIETPNDYEKANKLEFARR